MVNLTWYDAGGFGSYLIHQSGIVRVLFSVTATQNAHFRDGSGRSSGTGVAAGTDINRFGLPATGLAIG